MRYYKIANFTSSWNAFHMLCALGEFGPLWEGPPPHTASHMHLYIQGNLQKINNLCLVPSVGHVCDPVFYLLMD